MDCIVLGVAKIQTQLSDFHVELYCEYLYFTMIDQASVVKVIEVSGQETDPHVKKMQCLCLFLVRLEFMRKILAPGNIGTEGRAEGWAFWQQRGLG